MSVSQVAMAKGQTSGVASNFEEVCCVDCKLGFLNNRATTVSENAQGPYQLQNKTNHLQVFDMHCDNTPYMDITNPC